MPARQYRLAPLFAVRSSGVAFEFLDRLGTTAVTGAVHELVRCEAALARVSDDVIARGVPRKLESKLRRRVEIAPQHVVDHPAVEPYASAYARWRRADAVVAQLIHDEYRRCHDELVSAGSGVLQDFFVIGHDPETIRNLRAELGRTSYKSGHQRFDRTLALYLQRVCSKNDAISRFGPVAWGTAVPGTGVRMRPLPDIAQRRVELERWVVHGVIGAMNADPDVRLEVAPRLHPHGCFDGGGFVRLDEDRVIALGDGERAVAAACDGETPAHVIGDAPVLARLAELGVIRWEVEPLAIDAAPFASLVADVERWRAGPVRERWSARLAELATYPRAFKEDASATGREAIVAALHQALGELGVEPREHTRVLYAARNPLCENCLQGGEITVGAATFEPIVQQAAPWFELFADSIGLAAARAFRRLHEIIRAAPRRDGSLRYSTLVRVARDHDCKLENDQWLLRSGAETFEIIKRELGELLAGRPDARRWQLTFDDCTFLRRTHELAPVVELAYPSVDFQICAASPEDADAGRLQALIGEVHPGPALLQHATYWSCPDPATLRETMIAANGARPICINDSFAEAPVHVCPEAVMTAMPQPTYVGMRRPRPGWRAIRPADAEVFVDEQHADVRLRTPAGDDLGSIIRTVRLLTGMHPFFPFERVPHAPRLCVGEVVAQREAWHIDSAELGERPAGVSTALIAAVERLRADRGIPRWIFLRPSSAALPVTTWFGRDKDQKPIYIDLESVVFLDIFERRLRKYGSLTVIEMLPKPDELFWRLPGGRHTFELRTNVVPRI